MSSEMVPHVEQESGEQSTIGLKYLSSYAALRWCVK